MTGPMTPHVEPDLIDGPAIADAAALLAWLDAREVAGSKQLLRMPVVVEFDNEHRLGVARAWIGNAQTAPESAIQLQLDDSAMGVALLDTLRSSCPPGRRCAVVIDGIWGAVMPMPRVPEDAPSRKPLAVRRVVGVQSSPVDRVRAER